MNMSKDEYGKLVKKREPRSPMAGNLVKAFIIGGAICCLGQALHDLYAGPAGLGEEEASAAVSMTLVALSALLTGLNVYDKLARFAGAGTLVPITGFANAMVSPAMEYRAEGFILGLGAKMFSIAGPVIVYGLAASAVYGIVLCTAG